MMNRFYTSIVQQQNHRPALGAGRKLTSIGRHISSSEPAAARWSITRHRHDLAFPQGERSKRSPDLNATLSAFPVLLTQLALEDLAISVFRQLWDKLDGARLLIAGQVLPTEGVQFLLV